MDNLKLEQTKKPSMLFFLKDPPNICSIIGLLSALIGIYTAILGLFQIALVSILWAVFFDWADGIIARKMMKRTDDQRAFGSQFDSLIDVISFGVFPAIFLLSYGRFSPWFLPGAFLIIAVSTIRLGYFNVFGMIDRKTYTGLALDNNVIILSLLFAFESVFEHKSFLIILYAAMMIMLVFNLASIRTYKFTGRWFYVLTVYIVIMSVGYFWLF